MDSIIWVVVAAVLGVAEIFTLTASLGLLAVAALAAASPPCPSPGWRGCGP